MLLLQQVRNLLDTKSIAMILSEALQSLLILNFHCGILNSARKKLQKVLSGKECTLLKM
jgi:hypothetical protein